MKKIFLIMMFFSLQACGLTTKDLVSSSDKTKSTQIFAVGQQGIVSSKDHGLKWTQIVDKFPGQILELVKHGENYQLITTAGIYLLAGEKNQLTDIFVSSVNATALVNGKRYFVDDNFVYELGPVTVNRIVEANNLDILSFNNQLLAVTANQLLLLNQNEQWQPFLDFQNNIQEVVVGSRHLLVIAGEEVFKITNELSKQPLKISAIELKDKVKAISDQGYLYLADNENLLRRTFSGEVWDDFTPETGYLTTKVTDIKVKELSIYLAGNNGITYSLNGGQTWHRFNKSYGLPTDGITKIFIY